MAITTRLELRQSQSLVMTPQLQQAIKLLQLSNLELASFVDAELERNPLLEKAESADDGPVARVLDDEPAASPFHDDAASGAERDRADGLASAASGQEGRGGRRAARSRTASSLPRATAAAPTISTLSRKTPFPIRTPSRRARSRIPAGPRSARAPAPAAAATTRPTLKPMSPRSGRCATT